MNSKTVLFNKEVQALASDPANNECADCLNQGQCEWASVNLSVFVCTDCSGVHRNLGSHISKVKSVILDDWDKTAYESMLIGNVERNKILEPYVIPFEKPKVGDCPLWRKKYIIDKYVNQKFSTQRDLESSSSLTKMGFLVKEGSRWKTWKRRFFTIDGAKLNYYTSDDLKKRKGSFPLEKGMKIDCLDNDDKNRKFCFLLKSTKQLYLQASSEEEVLEWIYVFKAICDKL